MDRRQFLKAVGAVSISLPLAGCLADTSDNDEEDGDNQSGSDDEERAESESEAEVLVDEIAYDRVRFTERLEDGDIIELSIDVERGIVGIVDVANMTEGESIFREDTNTEDSWDVEIDSDGEYVITFQGYDRAHIKATKK